ncbi:MAG: hypothetical protein IPG39_19515 [Bacteroidetes bacterium]|nr:hypothetical protein [Bacteroidota bacterium]
MKLNMPFPVGRIFVVAGNYENIRKQSVKITIINFGYPDEMEAGKLLC